MPSHSPGYTSGGPRASIRRTSGRFCLPVALALVLLLPAAGLGQVPAPPSGVAAVVARYGLRPVEPPVPAREIGLPKLGGGRMALSDFAGRWVVLTFWATWCGPCRSEMPSLERLHRNREAAGVSVLGVSVDRAAAPAERFVEQYSLSFPNLWDDRGAAASEYRAQSIPLSYLIDPVGRVVGVSVGARDWLALQPMVDELVALVPPTDAESPEYEIADGPLELPRTFEPPTAEAVLVIDTWGGSGDGASVEVDEPFSVEVRVRWAGHFEDYLLHPPRILLPEQIEQADITASTRSADGRNMVVYRVDLEARQPGSYALNPIELIYTPRTESEAISSRVEGPTVVVTEATLWGAQPMTWLAAGGGLMAFMAAGWALGRRARSRRSAAAAGESNDYLELRGRLDAARRSRLEGDLRRAGLDLALLERDLIELAPSSDGGLDVEVARAEIDRLIEGARYGGYTPTREELDAIERRVARRVSEMEEDPRQAAREALRLRNQES